MYELIGRQQLQQLLRYVRPRNVAIYQEVFVHRSALKHLQRRLCEQTDCGTTQTEEYSQYVHCINTVARDDTKPVPAPPLLNSNERLEFLGDVVLSMAVTDYLYDAYPTENEGFLTKLRIKIVKGPTLAMFARKLGIEQYLAVSNSTAINGNILENAFEALVGAIYLDYRVVGMEMQCVKQFVFGVLRDLVDWDNMTNDDNYKDVLMRYMQKHHAAMPLYVVESTTGQAHRPVYRVSLTLTDEHGQRHSTSNEANTKRDAEQLCAKSILTKLKLDNAVITGAASRRP